jgi:ADP-ribosylglycohydrolase
MIDNISRFIGAFTGFTVGDAFGYPCREMTFPEICNRFEKNGCLRLAVSAKTNTALFTDATQMSLFTTDGILWASLSSSEDGVNYTEYVFYAYQLWLYTQTKSIAGDEYKWLFDKSANTYKSKLLKTKGLYQTRFMNPVNVDLLSKMRNLSYGKISKPLNNFSDSGALKRILPAGMFFNYDVELAFRAGADFAAITHGSPVSYLASGVYSAVIASLVNGESIDTAIEIATEILVTYKYHSEVLEVIEKVQDYLGDDNISPQIAVSRIGTDDDAAQVLGISLFCAALFEDSFENAIRLAVNQDGLSDVCGALTGGLLGAYHGAEFVPKKWVQKLSYLRLIEDIAISLVENSYFNEDDDDEADEMQETQDVQEAEDEYDYDEDEDYYE